MESDFYLRYYVGHKGKFGHEFLEFEFRPDGESDPLRAGARTRPRAGAGGRGSGKCRDLVEEGTDREGKLLCPPHWFFLSRRRVFC